MDSLKSETIVLQADQEHSGIRGVVLLGMVVAVWLSFVLLRALLSMLVPSSDYVGLFSCLASLPVALAAVWAGEQGLKRVWPSGRSITFSQDGVTAVAKGEEEVSIGWSEETRLTRWYFQLSGYQRGGHERRVPKGWLCLACQIQLDEKRIIAYSYLPKKKASMLLSGGSDSHDFRRLNPSDVYESSVRSRLGPPSRPTIPTSVLAGKDGRFWLAERRRWIEGFELTSADFGQLMKIVMARRG
jgi:hypothetical protein